MVGLSRTVLLPAGSDRVRVLVDPRRPRAGARERTDCTVEPLTIDVGRAGLVVVPLANRTATVAVPAAAAFTVNWAYAPDGVVAVAESAPE